MSTRRVKADPDPPVLRKGGGQGRLPRGQTRSVLALGKTQPGQIRSTGAHVFNQNPPCFFIGLTGVGQTSQRTRMGLSFTTLDNGDLDLPHTHPNEEDKF